MESQIIAFINKLVLKSPISAYIFFFINSVLQILFPPYPGDTIVVFQGYLSSHGILNTYLLLTVTLCGTYLSSIFLFNLGFKYHYKLFNNRLIKKYVDYNKVKSLESWFKRYGALVIIVSKFIPGLGFASILAAGIFKLPVKTTYISIAVSTLIHNGILFFAGRIAGDNMDLIKNIIFEYNKLIIICLFILSIVYLYIKFSFKRKPLKK